MARLQKRELEEARESLRERLQSLEPEDREALSDIFKALSPWKKGDADRRKNDRRKPPEKKRFF